MAEIAKYFATSFDLVLLQEIPTGHYGPYRLNQLVTAMNAGRGEEGRFSSILGRDPLSVNHGTSMLNAIIYPASWKILRQATLSAFLYPPVMAWFKPAEGTSTIVAGTFHISPSASGGEGQTPATPVKGGSTAGMVLIQNRLHRQLAAMVDTAKDWEVSVPAAFDEKDSSPRWIIGGDLNVIPDSLPYNLVYTTPKGMPTAVVSGRTLDGFLVDPLTFRTHNTLVDLTKVNRNVSDHHLVSLVLKEYD